MTPFLDTRRDFVSNDAMCTTCDRLVPITGERTELWERYDDGHVGPAGDPRRIPTRPAHTNVPGPSFLTLACGHEVSA